MARLIRVAAAYLSERGVEEPRLETELLLAEVLGLRRIDLYLRHDMPLADEQRDRFRVLARRRATGEPTAYILGRREFHGLEFAVDCRCLIPRPETEHLVDSALEWLAERGEGARVVDVGTGSGCIAISLLHERPDLECWAVDLSEEALEIAGENAGRLLPEASIRWERSDLLSGIPADEGFDLIVSNPPYIREDEMAGLDAGVRDFEPWRALCSGSDSLDCHRRLIAEAARRLRPLGALMMETGGTEEDARELERVVGDGFTSRTVRDLAGRERVFVAIRKD